MWFRDKPGSMDEALNAPLPARQANRLFMVLLERLTTMQLDMTKLRDAIAQLRTENDASHARLEAAHAAQLSDGQAAIDAAAADVFAIVAAQKGDAAPQSQPQPVPMPPVAVPFAPATAMPDVQTLLRAAMPGGAA